VQSDFNHLKVKITEMKNELQSHYANGYKASPDDRFFEVVQPFIDKAEQAFKKTEADMLEMETAFKDCVKFYGEDAAVMKADEFFGIFKTFSASFEKARGDNQKQEEKEAQKEKARTAAKARQEQMVAKKNRIRVQGEGKSLFLVHFIHVCVMMINNNKVLDPIVTHSAATWFRLLGSNEGGGDDKGMMDSLLETLRNGGDSDASRRDRRRKVRTTDHGPPAIAVKAQDLLTSLREESSPVVLLHE
jgi:cytokinesis protein